MEAIYRPSPWMSREIPHITQLNDVVLPKDRTSTKALSTIQRPIQAPKIPQKASTQSTEKPLTLQSPKYHSEPTPSEAWQELTEIPAAASSVQASGRSVSGK